MVENGLYMENIQENTLCDSDNEKPCEGCPKQLTKEFCPYCKYFLLYQRQITDVKNIVEYNLDEFYCALEQDTDQTTGLKSSREDLLEGPLKESAKTEISSVGNNEVVVEDLRKKNLPKKEKIKPKKLHLEFPAIKKRAKKLLDLTVYKRRQINFLNGIKNASVTGVLIESSLSATQPEKRLQERAHSNMDATRSSKKVSEIVKARPKHAPKQLNNNAITLVKNVGIIHILCFFFLPSFLFAALPKTEISSFLGLLLLLTYSTVSLYLISFSIRHLILRKNRFRTLTCRLKILRHELEKNAFYLGGNSSKKARLKYKNRFEEIKISKNPKNKDKNKQKQTIRGKEAFFSFLLEKAYGVKTGNKLEEVRKKSKKRAKLEEENRAENIEITFKRRQELARNKRDFYDFLLEKVFGKKHLKNNKLKRPISHLRPKKKKTRVKVIRRKRSVRLFRSHFRSYNESFENNSTNNSFTVPRKEDLKKVQELNKEIPIKSFRISHYHDMESRIEYEEKLTQEYRKEEGIPGSYLVNERIRDISDSDRVIGLYLEKNHREKFDKFFNRNLTLAKLLNYSTDLNLIKIAKNRDKWIIIADLNTDNNVLKQQLSILLEKVSKSILIFNNIELSYRHEYDRILSGNSYVRSLIPLQLQLNLIELSQNAKLINKILKFWLVSRKERRRFKKLLRMIRTSYQILNFADLIGLATLEAKDKRLPEKRRDRVKNYFKTRWILLKEWLSDKKYKIQNIEVNIKKQLQKIVQRKKEVSLKNWLEDDNKTKERLQDLIFALNPERDLSRINRKPIFEVLLSVANKSTNLQLVSAISASISAGYCLEHSPELYSLNFALNPERDLSIINRGPIFEDAIIPNIPNGSADLQLVSAISASISAGYFAEHSPEKYSLNLALKEQNSQAKEEFEELDKLKFKLRKTYEPEKSKLRQIITLRKIVPALVRLIPLLGVFIIAIITLTSPNVLLFTRDIIIGFDFVIILIPPLYIIVISEKVILKKKGLLIIAGVPFLTLLAATLFVIVGLENYVGFIVLFSLIFSQLVIAKQERKWQPQKDQKTKIIKYTERETKYYSLLYHKYKFYLLGTILFVLGIFFWNSFFLAPQNLFIPGILAIAFILLLTVKSKSYLRKLLILRKKEKLRRKNISHKSFLIIYEDRNIRAALLILIFLVCMPLLFTVNSMVSIETPIISFGRVDQSARIESSSLDFSTLDYAQNFDALEELSINDEFVVRAIINTQIGESAIMRVRIIPERIPGVYDYKSNRGFKKLVENGMRLQYDILSEYTTGPLTNANYYSPIELDELNLLPGQYRVECYYSIRTGWSMRSANPVRYTLNLEKDSLKILSAKAFDLGVEYGAVYTFENIGENSWDTFFDGKLVNSINEPIAGKKIDLFLEINDKYEKVATVETDAKGAFYHHHKIYGWVEDRMLAKIECKDDDPLYKELVHEEYAGLEEPVDGNWFFFDLDGNSYPDWDYSLLDLLGLYTSGTMGYSMPIQPDDFTFAQGNFYGPYGDLEFSDLSTSTLQPVRVGANYKIDVEIEWSINDNVESVEYLRWDYSTSGSPSVDFSIWNYNLHVYEVKTSSPFALTSDYYDAANNYSVKARIECTLKGSTYDIYLDQLRIDYIIGAPPEPPPVLAFMALFDENQGDTTKEVVNDLVGTLYGNISWVDGKRNSSLFFDGTGQVITDEGTPQTNYLMPIQDEPPDGEFTLTYGDFVSTADIEFDDGSETYIESDRIDNSYHEIDVEVQWGPQGVVDSMDYLHWAHRFEWIVTPTTNFQIWNRVLNGGSGDWETVSQNPFSLTSDYYDENYKVKVRYYAHADGRTSTIDLFIDQLKLEYTNTSGGSEPQYVDFDWVDFGDVLEDVLGPGSTNNQFVITGWINPSSFTSNQSSHGIKNVFFSKENIELGINESGYLQVYMNTNGVETTAYYGTDNAIRTNDWVYVAFRFNNSEVDVLLDEVWYYDAVGAVAEPWSGGGSLVDGGSLIIGAELIEYSCFTGRLDDLSVFREAISHFEIEAHKGVVVLKINASLSKEDGFGGWSPIAVSGEIIDGTDMQKFNEEYKYVIRGLLEGFLTLVTLAASENEIDGIIHLTDINGISAMNIIQGALTPEQLHFTESSSYYSLKEINFYDIEFYNKNYENEEYPGNVVDIMNLFKQYNLPTIPGTRIEDWATEWKYHWITDFFNNND